MGGEARTSKRRRARTLGGWLFLALVGILYVLVAAFDPAVVREALSSLAPLLVRILPVLAVVFTLLFLADLFLDRRWLVRRLGEASGIGGWALALVCGVLSAGPLYAWYPLLAELRAKGMSSALVAAFLYSRALKLPLLPLMVHYFGFAYTVAVSAFIVAFAIVNGLLTARVADRPASQS